MTTLRENPEAAEEISEEIDPTAVEDQAANDAPEAAEPDEAPAGEDDTKGERRRIDWSRVLAFALLPAVALLLTVGSGYLKWVSGSADDSARARAESVRAASDDAVVLLSYNADSVEKDLSAARERLTGEFKDAYTELTRQVVIPGAKEKHISSSAKVNAASSVSATANHAVALLFVDQTVTIGGGAPTDTQPVVRVTLDKVGGLWLVSRFDPV